MIKLTDGEYQVFIEGLPNNSRSPDQTMIRFWTKWTNAKNPEELQRKFEFGLGVEELDNFIDTLIGIRDAAVVRTAVHQTEQ